MGILREIARGQGSVGSEWRARWKASKDTGTPLFSGVVAEWNPSQVALSYWFAFYDSVYEHPERPTQKIIENDDLLNKWVEDQAKKVEEQAKKNTVNSSHNTRNALNYDEVIIFDNADEEYIEELEEYENEHSNVDVKFEGTDYYE